MSLRTLTAIGCGMELLYLSFYAMGDGAPAVLLFMVVYFLAFGLCAYVFYRQRSLPESEKKDRTRLGLILGFAVLFRLTLLPLDPVASDDIYRYLWDGKVALHGYNPYAMAPDDARLSALHTPDLPSKVNFPHMRTIYPPLSQAVFVCCSALFGDSVSGLKLILMLADVGSIVLLILLLEHLALPRMAIVAYAWSPLPVLYFGLDGHIDALGVFLLLLALFLMARARHVAAAVSFGASALAKLFPLILLPLFVKSREGAKWLLPVVIMLAVVAAGCLLYLEPTGGLYESLLVYNAHWEFNGAVFPIINSLLASEPAARIICGIAFLVWLGWVSVQNRPFIERTFLAFLGFVIFAPTVHPWYLSWLAALVVLRWSDAVFALLGLSGLSLLVVYQYRATGVWQELPVLRTLEYIPFVILLGWEIIRQKFPWQPDRPLER